MIRIGADVQIQGLTAKPCMGPASHATTNIAPIAKRKEASPTEVLSVKVIGKRYE